MHYKKISIYFILMLLLAACGQTKTPAVDESLEAQGLIFNVTGQADKHDFNLGDGVCAALFPGGWGGCTLRAAIEEANASAGLDQINVPSGSYNLSLGELEITDDLVIMGSRYSATIIDGQANDSIFYINDGAYHGTKCLRVELHYLTIRNGYILGSGAGILNSGAKVLVQRSIVNGNIAASEGAGIGNFDGGILELRYSTVSNNGDMWNDEPARGGGIYNSQNSHLLIFKSTINHNQANRYGGVANHGTVQMVNSTLSHNQSRIDTGGFLNTGLGTLSNVTLAFNEGTVDYDGTDHNSAGGLYNTGTLHIKNTIISDNINNFSFTQDCLGNVNSLGYNLIGDAVDCNLIGDLTGNQLDIDPLLKTLALNGAKTQTHAIDTNSPAYNAGRPGLSNGVGAACEATDQRNKTRGFGPAGRCDIGAYEYQGGPGGFVPK